MNSIEYLEKEYKENKGFLSSSNFEQAKEMHNAETQNKYTEEQVIEAIFLSRQFDSGWTYNEDEIIQSLKQPKNN